MRRLKGFVMVLRPHNVAAAVLSTLVGVSLAGAYPLRWKLLAAVATATAAGYTINDIYDFDIDKINKPYRPLPSGILSVRSVWALYAVLLIILVLLLLLLPRMCDRRLDPRSLLPVPFLWRRRR